MKYLSFLILLVSFVTFGEKPDPATVLNPIPKKDLKPIKDMKPIKKEKVVPYSVARKNCIKKLGSQKSKDIVRLNRCIRKAQGIKSPFDGQRTKRRKVPG